MKVLSFVLVKICDLTHMLPNKQEEILQVWFIDNIGYHCPFAVWSCRIDEKYECGIWKKP